MVIHAVADTPARLAAIRAILEPNFAVTSDLLSGATVQRGEIQGLVVKADLRAIENICALKKLLDSHSKVRKRIFLVDDAAHLYVSQAYALGASRVLLGTVDRAKLLAALADPTVGGASSVDARSAEAAAAMGEAALASMFTAVATGMPIDARGTKNAGRIIAETIAECGLSDWLTAVRRHHEGTYQHCLLVAGVAVDFGLSLGVPNADIERLSSAAMFHDIGKAKVPLAVLDKPGRLDPEERALIETHPVAGYDVLKGTNGISPEILKAVRHHHEYLDGSGYPDGLCAESIPDVVRLLTISDVFAALIEDRHYKPPLPRAQAYDILCGMHGKLEKPLLAAFGDVALHR